MSAVLGLVAGLLTGNSAVLRIVCLLAAFAISIPVWLFVFRNKPENVGKHEAKAHREKAAETDTGAEADRIDMEAKTEKDGA